MEGDSFRPGRRIEEEHSAIRVVMQWIRADLTLQLGSPGGLLAQRPLLTALKSFRQHLLEHFRFEEQGGPLTTAFSTLPNAAEMLRRWMEQHRSMMARIDEAILQLSSAATGETELLDSFASELNQLFADLRAHDRYETQLLTGTSEEPVPRGIPVPWSSGTDASAPSPPPSKA